MPEVYREAIEVTIQAAQAGKLLRTGWNLVVYTGQSQLASAAFASINAYLVGFVVYIDNAADLNNQVISSTLMIPHGVYWIEVSQDCSWIYGIVASAPTSVQLYSKQTDATTHGANTVAYSGPSQQVETAIASIQSQFLGAMYYDNTQKIWISVSSGYTMVPNTPYIVWVNQDVLWIFVTSDFTGIISAKELEYNSSRAAIPASDIPIGEDGLVHIWGRNDTDSAQQMGISWIIIDPDNLTVENYSDWDNWPYAGAGGEHEFIGGRFDMSKAGMYHISVNLLMNHDSPVVIDTYTGILCTILPAQAFANLAVSTFSRE